MTSLFSPAAAAAVKPEQGQALLNPCSAVCQTTPIASVGLQADETLRNTLDEAEIDAHIKSLGELADRAYKDGDPHGARIWTDRMYAAIRGRSATHQARLQAEVDRRIDELTFDGEWAREQGRRLGRRN